MNIVAYLQGKKTYIVMAIAFVYFGGVGIGLWPHNIAIDGILASAGGAALRAGVAKNAINTP